LLRVLRLIFEMAPNVGMPGEKDQLPNFTLGGAVMQRRRDFALQDLAPLGRRFRVPFQRLAL
jgi:hypothetical protein